MSDVKLRNSDVTPWSSDWTLRHRLGLTAIWIFPSSSRPHRSAKEVSSCLVSPLTKASSRHTLGIGILLLPVARCPLLLPVDSCHFSDSVGPAPLSFWLQHADGIPVFVCRTRRSSSFHIRPAAMGKIIIRKRTEAYGRLLSLKGKKK